MGNDYAPPGMVRLTAEVDRLTGACEFASNLPPSSLSNSPATAFTATDILSGNIDLKTVMRAVREGQEAAEAVRQRETEIAGRRRRDWGLLRTELALGKRKGWWWFPDRDGRIEVIPPHWWSSTAAEDAASRGVVPLMRTIGVNVHSMEAVVVIELEPTTAKMATPESEPAKEAPSGISSPPGQTDQLIELFREKGKTEFNGKPKDRIQSELKDAGIEFSKSEFEAAFTISVERGYLDKLSGAPRRGNRLTDSVKGS